MKIRKLSSLMVLAAFSLFLFPASLAAQDDVAQAKKAQHHHRKLIDIGTFGGPNVGRHVQKSGLDRGVAVNLIFSPGIPDDWNGGTGNWSNAGKWSAGEPGASSDVTIYSGGKDSVILDVGRTIINSLTLGGVANGFTSELTDGGIAQTLSIVTFLDIGQQGTLSLTGGSTGTVASGGASNSGIIDVEHGSTLAIAGDLTNSGSTYTDLHGFGGDNTISISGILTNNPGALFQLNGAGDVATIGTVLNNGNFGVNNGAAVTVTGSVNNGGYVDLENASVLTVDRDLQNAGTITTSFFGGFGSNTINISGMLTNSGTFALDGPGDMASVGNGVSNSGTIDVENGSRLAIAGDLTSSGFTYTDLHGFGGGNTISISGMLTNNPGSLFQLNGAGDVATIGTVLNLWNFGVNNGAAVTVLGDMNNSGGIDLEVRSLLRVNGNLQNSGSMTTSFFGNTGGNTISVGGLLTNQNSGNITLYGLGDALHANGGLINNGFVQVLNGSSVDQPFLGSLGIVGIDNTSKFVVGTGAASGQGYIQLVNGTLGEMITTSDFGQIYVIGSVSLNGTLDIMLQSGFNPPVGTSYDIILFSPSGLTGTFATIQNDIFNNGTEMWLLTYDNAGGLVELTAEAHVVPEPGSLLMLLSGVMAAGYGFRRKLL